MPKLDQTAEDADTGAFVRINLIPMSIVTISYAVVVFLSAYIAQDPMRQLVDSMPAWLTHAFEITGGILPAIGFAMLLNNMLRGRYIPYLIIGFLISTFLDFGNILPVALAGLALALITFYNMREREDLDAMDRSSEGVDSGDGI